MLSAGIYRSNNSGLKWTKLTSGSVSTYSGKAKWPSKSNPSILYASIADFDHSIGFICHIRRRDHWTLEKCKRCRECTRMVFTRYCHRSGEESGILFHMLDRMRISWIPVVLFLRMSSWDAGDNGRVPVGGSEGIDIYVHADIHFHFIFIP